MLPMKQNVVSGKIKIFWSHALWPHTLFAGGTSLLLLHIRSSTFTLIISYKMSDVRQILSLVHMSVPKRRGGRCKPKLNWQEAVFHRSPVWISKVKKLAILACVCRLSRKHSFDSRQLLRTTQANNCNPIRKNPWSVLLYLKKRQTSSFPRCILNQWIFSSVL